MHTDIRISRSFNADGHCVKDPHIPKEGRAKVWQALEEAGVTFTWHEFNGQHAFMRDEGPRYDPELALQARIGELNWEICYEIVSELVTVQQQPLGRRAVKALSQPGGWCTTELQAHRYLDAVVAQCHLSTLHQPWPLCRCTAFWSASSVASWATAA